MGRMHELKKRNPVSLWVVSIFVVILALYLAVVIGLKIFTESSWEKHTDIQEYGMLDDGQNALELFDIWPQAVTENMDVQEYLLIYYCPFDSNYLGLFTVAYDETEYKAEVERLGEYSSTEYIGLYGAEGFHEYELLAMNASDSGFVYAIHTGENTITYVGILFPGYGTDIDYQEYIPEEYLPAGVDIGKDNPTRQEKIEKNESE